MSVDYLYDYMKKLFKLLVIFHDKIIKIYEKEHDIYLKSKRENVSIEH